MTKPHKQVRKGPFLERMFPIKSEQQGQAVRMSGEIPWALAELVYGLNRNEKRTLQQVADDGGWTWSEFLTWVARVPDNQISYPLPISRYVGTGCRK